jgi:undecaprenyl pyrophosphate synthase
MREEKTAANTGMLFNIALNYGGRAEIVEAAQAHARAGVAPTSSTSAFRGSSTPPASPIPIC